MDQKQWSYPRHFQAIYAPAMIFDASNLWNGFAHGDSKRMRMDEKVKPKVDLFKVLLWPSNFDASYKAMKDRYAIELKRLLHLSTDDPGEAYRLARHHIEQMDASGHPHPDMPPADQTTRDASPQKGREK